METTNLSSATLIKLAAQAMVAFIGHAPRFETSCRAGVWKITCGEPVADLNYVITEGGTPEARAELQEVVADLDARDVPFCCMLSPGTEDGLKPACEAAGLVYAVDWPLMVCPAGVVQAHSRDDVRVGPLETERDAADMANILAGAFKMPEDAVLRTLPLAVAQAPGLDIFLARIGNDAASTVTVTRHGNIAGIWAMGTPPEMQGQGVGKVLLSQVMDQYRNAGVEAFFLGATPAGRPLYEKLGYAEVARAQVWVRGETSQA